MYEQAIKDFQNRVVNLTYFDSEEHTTVGDLCYLCLHELDMHAEGEYWHPLKDRKALLKFCQKWGAYAYDTINYPQESQRQFDLGKNRKKSEAHI